MSIEIICGEARETLARLPERSLHSCITSPPYYGLRSYGGGEHEIGAERTPAEYGAHLVEVFAAVWRVLRDDGTLWLNLGDSYAGGKRGRDDDGPADIARRAAAYGAGRPKALAKGADGVARKPPPGLAGKNLLGIPWRVAFALQDAGWVLRSAITWCKTAPMPESVQDRPTSATEMVFLLSKNSRYFYDATAISEATSRTDYIHAGGKGQGIKGAAAAHRFAAQRSHVPGDGEVAPYLVLASLLGLEGIFGKEWHDDFYQFLDVLKRPFSDGSMLLLPDDAPDVRLDIVQHLGIIIAQSNLESQSVFRTDAFRAFADAMVNYEASFTIEEAGEVISKIIANAQTIRQAFTQDAFTKRLVNIDMIDKAVALLDCVAAFPRSPGNLGIAQAFLKHVALALAKNASGEHGPPVWHGGSPLPNYITVGQEEPATRNARNWWVIGPQPFSARAYGVRDIDHYAVFPEELAQRCILAGTSEAGCCPRCLAPYRRVVERKRTIDGVPVTNLGKWRHRDRVAPTTSQRVAHARIATTSVERGWQPGCPCEAGPPIPCTTLDPFLGSGTTALVSKRLGRSCVGIELNGDYVKLAERRVASVPHTLFSGAGASGKGAAR